MAKTYGSIFREFLESTDIKQEIIADWRPCQKPYFEVSFSMAIIVWLKNGSRIIYISEKEE